MFALSVRERNYSAGRELFADEILGFGTYSGQLVGLDALVENQWKPVWSVTRNFHFKAEMIRCEVLGDAAWIAAAWESEGRAAEGGEWHIRNGRATLILQRREGGWRAVHSHFSLQPRHPDSATLSP